MKFTTLAITVQAEAKAAAIIAGIRELYDEEQRRHSRFLAEHLLRLQKVRDQCPHAARSNGFLWIDGKQYRECPTCGKRFLNTRIIKGEPDGK